MTITKHRRLVTREIRVRVLVLSALVAGVALLAIEIAATFAAPIERRASAWGLVNALSGDVRPAKTLDPAASPDSVADRIQDSSAQPLRTPAEPRYDELLRRLTSDSSGICRGEVAQSTRPNADLVTPAASRTGEWCPLDRNTQHK